MGKKKTLRLFSWNVNGIRACGRKGFLDWLEAAKPDILGLQETRALPEQLEEPLRNPDGYQVHFHPAEKKGYSGVGLYSRVNRKASSSVASTTRVRFGRAPDHRRLR